MNTPDNLLNILLECNRRDHSPSFSAGDQKGPIRTSRAFAIVLRAMHDAYYKAGGAWPLLPPAMPVFYLPNPPAPPAGLTPLDALHGAAVTAMLALYPKLAAYIHEQAQILGATDGPSLKFGRMVAEKHVSSRYDDGSDQKDSVNTPPNTYGEAAGVHQSDPDNEQAEGLGARWGMVKSFITGVSGNNIQLSNPPCFPTAALDFNRTAPGYVASVKDVMDNGNHGIADSNPTNALIGIFWAYDGANLIGTPPRLYLQIIQKVANTHGITNEQKVLLYSAAATAMGEAGIQAWYNKYYFNLWRPAVGVREHDASMGTEATAGAPAIIAGNPFWQPLGAPRSNASGKNFTPDFPAYPSGHATFGAASLRTTHVLLSKFTKKKEFPFEFVSDECNGYTKDVSGSRRSRHLRKFKTLEEAYIENGVSRVYLGVHWRFDSHLEKNGKPVIKPPGDPEFVGGLPLGLEVAKQVLALF